MNWAQKKHVLETLAEWLAPAWLAAAAGWAGWRVGVPLVGAIGLAAISFAAGRFVMGQSDSDRKDEFAPFEAAPIETVEAEQDELLLLPENEVLELDDPLVEPPEDSRVVRLFSRPEPTPGELVDRIADFLGDGRRPLPMPERPVVHQQPVDASAALHAALANIRASLR